MVQTTIKRTLTPTEHSGGKQGLDTADMLLRKQIEAVTPSTLEQFVDRFRALLTDIDELLAFNRLEAEGSIRVASLTKAELTNLYEEGRLLFRDTIMLKERGIGASFDPKRAGMQPVILVKQTDDRFSIVNGNQRIYTAINHNPQEYPICVVIFNDTDSFEQVFHMNLSSQRGTPEPVLG